MSCESANAAAIVACMITASPDAARVETTLERLRKISGLSRETLAAEAGVCVRTIYGLELEGRRPHRATARALAQALCCEPEDLR